MNSRDPDVTTSAPSRCVMRDDDKCVSCGICVPQCPVSALVVDPDTMEAYPEHDIYRPLRTLCFALERRLGREGAWLHHGVGILLHGLNGCLVLALILLLFPPCRERLSGRFCA